MKKSILGITLLLATQIYTMEPPALQTESWETESQQGAWSPALPLHNHQQLLAEHKQSLHPETRNAISPPIPVPLRPHNRRRSHQPHTGSYAANRYYPDLETEVSASPQHQIPSAPYADASYPEQHRPLSYQPSTPLHVTNHAYTEKQSLGRISPVSQSSSLPSYVSGFSNDTTLAALAILELLKQQNRAIETSLEENINALSIEIEKATNKPLEAKSPRGVRRKTSFIGSTKMSPTQIRAESFVDQLEAKNKKVQEISTPLILLIAQTQEHLELLFMNPSTQSQ
jgi:hypothetical protein